MFCAKCGSQIADNAKFCPSCGEKVQTRHAAVAPATAAAPTAPAPVTPVRRTPPVALLAILFALVLGLGVGAWFLFFSPYPINDETFPDPALRQAALATYDADQNGELSREEAAAVKEINLASATELSGMGRFFPNVERLQVTGGMLASLDVSDLPKLAEIQVDGEPLQQLDVSKNAELVSLSAEGTGLTSLDVSHNSKLGLLAVDDAVSVSGLDATLLREEHAVSAIQETYVVNGSTSYTESYEVTRNQLGQVEELTWESSYPSSSANSGRNVSKYSYDDQGRVVLERRAINYLGRLEEIVLDYTYDNAGHLTTIVPDYTSNVSFHRVFSYDDAGHVASIVYPDLYDMTIELTCDTDGNLLRWTQPEDTYSLENSLIYDYNEQGLCTRMTHQMGADDENPDTYPVSLSYDGEGRLVQVTPDAGNSAYSAASYAYDEDGRMTYALFGLGFEVALSYDEQGRVQRVTENVSRGINGTREFDLSYQRLFVPKESGEPAGVSVVVMRGPADTNTASTVSVWSNLVPIPATSPFQTAGETVGSYY